MTKTLTYETAVQALDAVIAEFGADTRYEDRHEAATGKSWTPGDNCYYRVDDKPLCIVGVVFDRLDIPIDPRWENTGAWNVVDQLRDDGWTIDSMARELLIAAQQDQDAGATWGEAVENAKQAVRTIYLDAE